MIGTNRLAYNPPVAPPAGQRGPCHTVKGVRLPPARSARPDEIGDEPGERADLGSEWVRLATDVDDVERFEAEILFCRHSDFMVPIRPRARTPGGRPSACRPRESRPYPTFRWTRACRLSILGLAAHRVGGRRTGDRRGCLHQRGTLEFRGDARLDRSLPFSTDPRSGPRCKEER